jgi:hypothetical protein
VVEGIQRKPYDLLDHSRTQFDRDLLEFCVQMNDLEAALQVGGGAAQTDAAAGHLQR